MPVFDDRVQFEFLILEGAQAGLSWSTILNKRAGYRKAFADFDPVKVARFTEKRIGEAATRPGHCQKSTQGSVGGRQCQGLPGRAKGIR